MRTGLDLFLVEENTVDAIELETILEDLGHRVVEVAASLGQALDRLEEAAGGIDGVLLTPRLIGQSARPLVLRLARLGIPYVVLTDAPHMALRRMGFRAPRLAQHAPPAAVARAIRDLSAITPPRRAGFARA
jgi:CheY-like chemotaxis protein